MLPPIDWTNPTVQGAWVAAAVAFVAAMAGFGGAILGALIGARAARHGADVGREEAQADRDDAAKARQEARDDARQARFVDQKRELYTALWTACVRHKREVEAQVAWRHDAAIGRGGEDPGLGSSEPARQAFLALTLLATYDITAAAERLYDATTTLAARHAYVRPAKGVLPPLPVKWDLNAWSSAAAAFENAARDDLLGEV